MKKLAIVIVNYNGGKRIVDLVKRLLRENRKRNFRQEIVVVDNKSHDHSVAKLSSLSIVLIQNTTNEGFAGGCNKGIAYARAHEADAILFLNPDVSLTDDCIGALLESKFDIAGPVIQFKRDGRWIWDHGGIVDWQWGSTHHIELSHPSQNESSSRVDYISGCAMCVKMKVFSKVGVFDTRYFLYFEDVDFCIRAKRAGFSLGVIPKYSIIHHLVEGDRKPFIQQLMLVKSNFVFINVWIPQELRLLPYIRLLLLSGTILVRYIMHI